MQLTDEEKQLILNKRKQEEDEKPKKTGILKHDLYFVQSDNIDLNVSKWSFINEKEMNDIISAIRESFELTVPQNTKFVCYIDDGTERWFDDEDYGVEGMPEDWAKENLVDIQEIRRKRKKSNENSCNF